MKRELVVPWSIAPTYSAIPHRKYHKLGIATPGLRADHQDMQALALQPSPTRGPDTHRSAGQRLIDAFEALERFPVLSQPREALRKPGTDMVAAVESDLGLASAVLREANRGRARTQIGTVPEALERIGDLGLHAIVAGTPTFDFLGEPGPWGSVPQAYRMHVQGVQRAADRIARALHHPRTDELRVVVMLHDVGKLVLAHAHRNYWELRGPAVRGPERQLERERRVLGVDHAVVGGVLARRWGLPDEIARAIERHHQDDVDGLPALTRLADMIARFEGGNPVRTPTLRSTARSAGLDLTGLREVLAGTGTPARERRSTRPCPLTPGEHRVVSELANGRVYKEIAAELDLSVSTVRTHLYNTYRKLGVGDRAQAILLAKDNGWI
jgi:putative nucleotidyltransferase with HDIG domain